MKRLPFLLAALWAGAALAQTVTDQGWTLSNGAATLGTGTSQSACIAAAEALPAPAVGASVTYECSDLTTIVEATPLPAVSTAGAYITGPTGSSSLTDNAGTAWTLNAGVVYSQPVSATVPTKAGFTSGVGTLLWFGGKIHQQNPACLWWNWSGTAWASETGPGTTAVPVCGNASPSGTVVTAAGQKITDAANNAWTIAAGVVQENGAAAGFSANVIALAYVSGKIYQENSACQWYGWTTATPPWAAVAAPIAGPTCPAAGSSSSGSSSGGASSGSSSSSSSSSSSGGSSSGSSSSGSSSGVTTAFGIKVCGNRFCNLNGAVLQVQGVSVSGLETNFAPTRWAAFANTTVAQWKQIFAAWGINAIRLYIDEWSWRTNPTPSNSTLTYRQIVQTANQNINAAGGLVIDVLMWAAPASVMGGKANGQPGMITTGSGEGDGVTFWISFAGASFVRNNPAIILELFNEPYYDGVYGDAVSTQGRSTLLNGGTMQTLSMQNNTSNNAGQTFTGSFTIAGTQAMLNAIRNAGFTGVVLYPKPWWNGEMEWDASVRPVDPANNLGSAHHQYGYNPGVATAEAAFQTVLNAGMPILITETYGLGNIGGFAFAQANKIGYVYGPGPNNWGSANDLSKMIGTPPWDGIAWGSDSFNYDAWPPFGDGGG